MRYPVTYIYNDISYQAITPPPNQLLLNMSGVGWNLLRRSIGLKVDPIQIRLDDPTEVKKIVGTSLTSLITDQIDDLSLNYILTDTLSIDFSKRVKQTFPIIVDSSSVMLEKNYFITSSISQSIDTVVLVGPSTYMDSINEQIVLSIPEGDIDSDYDEDISIKFFKQELFSRNPPTVNVKFKVSEFVPLTFTLPFDTINFPENTFPADSTYALRILVSDKARDTITSTLFAVQLDYLKMSDVDSTITPELILKPQNNIRYLTDSTKVKVLFNE